MFNALLEEGALSCADKVANARSVFSEIEAWQTALSLPDTVGEECARMEAFETGLFNIGTAVTSVRWHFGSTIKIQRWPCCFDNQLSMHNIPPVCATWISPGPGFSSALIHEKRETFHSTPKKGRDALCADKGVKRRKVVEGRKKKKSWQIRADIYLHYLERSSNWFHSSGCELWSRKHKDHLRAEANTASEKAECILCVRSVDDGGRMHFICCPRRGKHISQRIRLISILKTSWVVVRLLSAYRGCM